MSIMEYGEENIMKECDSVMQKYFTHVYLAEACAIVSSILGQDGKKEAADMVYGYMRKVLRARPKLEANTESAFNPFGAPQMLPKNWRYFAQGPFCPSHAMTYRPEYAEIMKEVLNEKTNLT